MQNLMPDESEYRFYISCPMPSAVDHMVVIEVENIGALTACQGPRRAYRLLLLRKSRIGRVGDGLAPIE